MRKNLSVSDWLNQKFGDDIPEKCLDAFEDDSLILLPLSFRNSYIKELKFPIPLFLPDTKIAEIGSEYQDLAEEELERKQSNLELIHNSEDEIYHAVDEMINYVNGNFEFDENLQNKFRSIYKKNMKNKINDKFFVSEYFIKKNLNLFN